MHGLARPSARSPYSTFPVRDKARLETYLHDGGLLMSRRILIRDVRRATARAAMVPERIINECCKVDSYVLPRHLAMWAAYHLTDKSIDYIAGHFNRHHATVIYGVRAFEKRVKYQPKTVGPLIRRMLVELMRCPN